MSVADKFLGAALLTMIPNLAGAAELPDHEPLRILVIGDEVNPHKLSDAELTQPADLANALSAAGNGLNVEDIEAIDSQCVDDGLAALSAGGVDVVVYFAHLAALGCDGSDQQPALTAAFESHLENGGGIVVFHHGIFEAAGKEGVLQLLGGRAGSIAWDTGAGQDVIAVAPEHFVASEALEFSGTRSFEGAGVAGGDYPLFNNTPDERYDDTSLLTAAGEDRTILFASADAGGGAARVLGYDLHRPSWMGHVVFYQPGEYQPQALDDVDGNNFQVLANAIYYTATTQEEGGGTGGPSEGTGEPPGDTDASGGADGTGDAHGGTGTDGHADATATVATPTGSGADGDDGDGSGCSCRTQSAGPWGYAPLLALLGFGFARRRRR